MSFFTDFILKLLPLYIFIFLGFISGKLLDVKKETIASILIYILTPIIVFNGVYTANLNAGNLSLPILFFAVCSAMCLLLYFIGRFVWKDSTKNILGFTSGSGNVGYFGLPVALALFGDEAMSTVVLIVLGFILYENTIGFFIVAKGNYSVRESLKRLIKLPAIYAFLIGVLFNTLKINLGQNYFDSIALTKGAYTLLGMMLIGIAMASIKKFSPDFKFTFFAFAAKFLLWPVIILTIVSLDAAFFGFYSNITHRIMLLLSIVPLAANTVAYATALNTHPDKAAFAVLLSTLFALFYIPFFMSFII